MTPLEAVEIYKELLNQLPEIVKSTGYKDRHIYEKMKMSKATFYRKMRTKTWTVDEVEGILMFLSK